MNDDPSKGWDRLCEAEEHAALETNANRVAEILKAHGIVISCLDVGKKMYFFEGKTLTAEWVRDEDGEIDPVQTALAAMVSISQAALLKLQSIDRTNPIASILGLRKAKEMPDDQYELLIREIALAALSAGYETIGKMLDETDETLSIVHRRLLDEQGSEREGN
jgi:hypothetical protein